MNNYSYERDDTMSNTFEFNVNNLDCAHCGAKIEALISDMQTIESAALNFPLKKLTVTGEVDDETVMLMNELAKAIEPDVELVRIVEKSESHAHSHEEEGESLKSELILLIVGILVFISAILTKSFELPKFITIADYILAYLILGKDVLVSAFRNIKSKNFFDENTLMTVATIGGGRSYAFLQNRRIIRGLCRCKKQESHNRRFGTQSN